MRLALLKEDLNVFAFRMPSCLMMSCSTCGVAVAVRATMGAPVVLRDLRVR